MSYLTRYEPGPFYTCRGHRPEREISMKKRLALLLVLALTAFASVGVPAAAASDVWCGDVGC